MGAEEKVTAGEQPLVEGVQAAATEQPSSITDAPKESPREISAATIGRMMGLATISDVRMLESKVDLLSTKLSTLTLKLDKLATTASQFPSGSDLERIDVQIGSLKNLIRESLTGSSSSPHGAGGADGVTSDPSKKKPNVFVSTTAEAPKA